MLYALEDSRAEGAVKGLVQAATGVGKTYLAAFDSAKYARVLFVAHREEYFPGEYFDYVVIDEYDIIGQVQGRPILKAS